MNGPPGDVRHARRLALATREHHHLVRAQPPAVLNRDDLTQEVPPLHRERQHLPDLQLP